MLRFTILLICVLVPLTISKTIKPLIYATVCDHCEYGYILDENGQSTCQCKQSPCENGQAPLSGYFCGRGPNHTDCPSDSLCIIAPDDSYAVCCPSNQQSAAEPMTTTTEPVTTTTEPVTKAPTKPVTKAPAEPVTKAPAEPVTEAPTKPGSCPPPSNKIGMCIATCTTDNDCEGNLKCCGNCPRECVVP